MEELRSTDILDKEIESDAIKKAQSIRDAANTEAQKILAQVESRLEKAKAARANTLLEKENKHKKDVEASIPLEKQRFRISFIADSVNKALNDYLKKLPQSKRLEIVLKPLSNSNAFAEGKKFNASVYGFKALDAQSQIEKLLGQKLLSCKEIDASHSGEEAIEGIELREGIILESDDAKIKCRFTLEEAINEVKNKCYKELVDALLPNIGGLE